MSDRMSFDRHHKVLNTILRGEHFTSDWLHPTQVSAQDNAVCLYIDGGTGREVKGCFEEPLVGADENLIERRGILVSHQGLSVLREQF